MKEYYCPVCREVNEVLTHVESTPHITVTLRCKTCNAISAVTYIDDDLPTRLEGSE